MMSMELIKEVGELNAKHIGSDQYQLSNLLTSLRVEIIWMLAVEHASVKSA
jgi:hypothetical protein